MLCSWVVGEDSWESFEQQGDQTHQSERKSTLNINWKDWYWSWNFNTLDTWWEKLTHWKDPDGGKDWGQKQKGIAEDKMVGWHHWLNGHEFGWTPGVGNGQGSLACCSPWGCKELDMTEWKNWTEQQLKERVAILISEGAHFRARKIIMDRGVSHNDKEVSSPRRHSYLLVYESNNRALKHVRQKRIELQGAKDYPLL